MTPVPGPGGSRTTPAVLNAIANALPPAVAARLDMPTISERVWRALHGA